MALGAIRHHVVIDAPADAVWALAGDPSRLTEWFPGIIDCRVDGTARTITTSTGLTLPETILVNDPVLRRFQYEITLPMFSFHRGTIDVLEFDFGRCVAVYATEADPRAMAMMIGAGAARALEILKHTCEKEQH
jgi:hypothetical protein